ncbi:protein TIC 20-IV, chloroplastic-like [Herrania umbratica]|uniref:Protein TIC 20 n=1 Tax=Herrania umbratica TaxID=108875 RepID=A0A6J0ZUU1_9ROSI|nr:protein TIC 20-IV, chloroplastic-like [Herrania umbratica]
MASAIAAVSAPAFLMLAKPSPPQAALWSKDLILEPCIGNYRGCKPSNVTCKSSLQANLLSSSNICAPGFLSSTGTWHKHPVALSSQFLGEEEGDLLHKNHFLARQRKSRFSPRACKDDIFKFNYPVITEKPDWWWRTLACVPYLIALQISSAGYFIQPLAEHYDIFESFVYFVPGAIRRLHPWFSKIYSYIGIGIVKDKDWPHFFRFHLMMGMLLETALQLIWYTGNVFPLIHYNGRFGMYFWAGIGFFYILTLLICVRSALGGKYAHIPFVSDAAYIHTRFNIVSFQRPF